MNEYFIPVFIPNIKHKNTVYLKLYTQIYCIPQNPGRPDLWRQEHIQWRPISLCWFLRNPATGKIFFEQILIKGSSSLCKDPPPPPSYLPSGKVGEGAPSRG